MSPPAAAAMPGAQEKHLVAAGRFRWNAETPQSVSWVATPEAGGLRLDFTWKAWMGPETEPSPVTQGPEVEHYRKTVRTILAGH